MLPTETSLEQTELLRTVDSKFNHQQSKEVQSSKVENTTTYRRGPHVLTPFTQRMKYKAVMAPLIIEGTTWKK